MTLGTPNITVETPLHVPRVTDTLVGGDAAEERISVATQRQLMWWRFRKHSVAMLASAIVLVFYAAVVLAGFLASAVPEPSPLTLSGLSALAGLACWCFGRRRARAAA